MKALNSVLKYLACLLIIVVAFITVIDITSFNKSFYRHEYEKYHVYDTIKISQNELEAVTDYLLDYIKDKNSNLTITATINGSEREVFNEKETLHMIDVKNLYLNAVNLRNLSFVLIIFILGYLYLKNDFFSLGHVYFNVLKLLAVFLSSVSFYAMIDFERFWINFHYIFFDNELFFLDPSKDILIMMVPEGFFMDLVFKIILYFILVLIALGFIAYYFRRHKNDSCSTL